MSRRTEYLIPISMLVVALLAIPADCRALDGAESSDSESVVRDFVAAADSHQWQRLEAVITDDHLFSMNGYEVRGEEDLQKIWQGWWEYAPRFETEILEIIPARDSAVVTVLSRVSGPGVVRDGVRIDQEWSFPVVAVVRIRGGRVAEWREFFDASEMESIGEE